MDKSYDWLNTIVKFRGRNMDIFIAKICSSV